MDKIQEKTKLLNELIQEFKGQTLKSAELRKLLVNRVSSNIAIVVYLMKSFPSVKIGREKLYEMPKQPIYYKIVEGAYKRHNSNVKRLRNKKKESATTLPELPVEQPIQQPEPQILSTEQTISMLKAEGYKVMKPLRFDEENFRRDHPELYQEYLIYECI